MKIDPSIVQKCSEDIKGIYAEFSQKLADLQREHRGEMRILLDKLELRKKERVGGALIQSL